MRVGIGYDVHPLTEGHLLVLGGVEIPFERGLAGWSDADVLAHAIIDALLGAAGLGDIGTHFPPSDPRYDSISSISLLRQVGELLKGRNWRISNIDATILAEQPRLAPFIGEMRRGISQALSISQEQVGLKATTSEGLGFAGRGEGIAAYAVALVDKEEGHEGL